MATPVIAGARTGGATVWFYNASGSVVSTLDHGADVYCIATDASGNIYIGGDSVGGVTHRKYNSAGSVLWSADHGARVNAIAVDSSGNVYIGGALSGSVGARKYNSAGALQWSTDTAADINAVCIGQDGYFYTAGGNYVNKSNVSDGVSFFNVWHGATLRAVAVDSSGNIYCGGDTHGSYSNKRTYRKYDSSGNLIWYQAWETGDSVYAMLLADGYLYVGGYSSPNFYKVSLSGTVQWSATNFRSVKAIAVDAAGVSYVTSIPSGIFQKNNSSGGYVWNAYYSTAVNGVALLPDLDTVVYPPGLPIPLALALPTIESAFLIPALALGLSLASPTVPSAPVPPLGDGQRIYRCYATGLPSLVEWQLRSLQCKKRRNDSTWLYVEIAATDLLLSASLDALIAVGGQIVIYSGLRYSLQNEVMGEMLRAVLTEYRYEKTAFSLSFALTCRVAATLEVLQTRVLSGVVSRGDVDGRRSVQCAVHPQVRPGDTVNDGLRTFIAHTVMYFIGASESFMTIDEAPLG